MFDIYSVTHIFWPLLLMWICRTLFPNNKNKIVFILIIAVVLFEVVENTESEIIRYRRIEINDKGETTYRGDSTINVIGDIMMNLLGITLGYYLNDSNCLTVLILLTATITSVLDTNYWISFFNFVVKPIFFIN